MSEMGWMLGDCRCDRCVRGEYRAAKQHAREAYREIQRVRREEAAEFRSLGVDRVTANYYARAALPGVPREVPHGR